MKLSHIFIATLLIVLQATSCAQDSSRPHCTDSLFDKAVSMSLSFSVPVISSAQLKTMLDKQGDSLLLLDTREWAEYQVSHIEGATHAGYDHFEAATMAQVDKNTPIVVYCSIGYRSEKIGERLIDMGYTEVYNLYGSLFEWANTGNPVVDSTGQPTQNIHTYDKLWSRWVQNPAYKKIW